MSEQNLSTIVRDYVVPFSNLTLLHQPLARAVNTANTVPLTPNQALTSSIGAIIIECLTVLGAVYLLFPLGRQGLVKLRVRLLIGMVVSDLALGLVGLISSAGFLAGHPLKVSSKECNAVGFLIVSILFTQHLWTLVIAIATFGLLKYPMSYFTHMIDRFWIWIPIVIWVGSFVHAGVWWHYFGFVPSSSGSLCYYGPAKWVHGRDMVQFVPRATVFVVVIVLYSQLFRFLRRPDSIQLSSAEVSETDGNPYAIASQTDSQLKRTKTAFKLPRLRTGSLKVPTKDARGEDIPPWEKLHINNVGGILCDVPAGPSTPEDEDPISPSWPQERKNTDVTDITLVDESDSNDSDLKMGNKELLDIHSPIEINLPYITEGEPLGPVIPSSRRGSTQSILKTGIHDNPLHMSSLVLPHNGTGRRVSIDQAAIALHDRRGSTAPTQSLHSLRNTYTHEVSVRDEDSQLSDETPEQTLAEFFATQPQTEEGRLDQAKHNEHYPTGGRSAANYFNRQASLLMLYFPIAYMIVFAFSLARLMYDMITARANVVLTTLSLWMVLSVGLVDALVYGLAEYIVRRRVRKRHPDQFINESVH